MTASFSFALYLKGYRMKLVAINFLISTNCNRNIFVLPKERMRDMWVPRFRWIPEHSIHIRQPRLREPQVGDGAEQSTQMLFPATSWKDISEIYIKKSRNKRGFHTRRWRLPAYIWFLIRRIILKTEHDLSLDGAHPLVTLGCASG